MLDNMGKEQVVVTGHELTLPMARLTRQYPQWFFPDSMAKLRPLLDPYEARYGFTGKSTKRRESRFVTRGKIRELIA